MKPLYYGSFEGKALKPEEEKGTRESRGWVYNRHRIYYCSTNRVFVAVASFPGWLALRRHTTEMEEMTSFLY
jgi:hypothetical protein